MPVRPPIKLDPAFAATPAADHDGSLGLVTQVGCQAVQVHGLALWADQKDQKPLLVKGTKSLMASDNTWLVDVERTVHAEAVILWVSTLVAPGPRTRATAPLA